MSTSKINKYLIGFNKKMILTNKVHIKFILIAIWIKVKETHFMIRKIIKNNIKNKIKLKNKKKEILIR